jgi:hypothetical protein
MGILMYLTMDPLRPDATIQHMDSERTLLQELCIRARAAVH